MKLNSLRGFCENKPKRSFTQQTEHCSCLFNKNKFPAFRQFADPGGRGVSDVGLRAFACWGNCGFECLWGWAWMSVYFKCCVLSGLCDGPITSPEESYQVWCVWVWSRIFDNEDALAQWGEAWCAMVKQRVYFERTVLNFEYPAQ